MSRKQNSNILLLERCKKETEQTYDILEFELDLINQIYAFSLQKTHSNRVKSSKYYNELYLIYKNKLDVFYNMKFIIERKGIKHNRTFAQIINNDYYCSSFELRRRAFNFKLLFYKNIKKTTNKMIKYEKLSIS